MSADKVRWGIISTARIAETAFVPAVRQTRRGEVAAVASRSRDKGESFAREHGIPQVFDDYASLLASDEVDAVYNPLPNTMHREWTEAAAAAGKHVFCEKPLATTAADAEAMVAACEEAGGGFLRGLRLPLPPADPQAAPAPRRGGHRRAAAAARPHELPHPAADRQHPHEPRPRRRQPLRRRLLPDHLLPLRLRGGTGRHPVEGPDRSGVRRRHARDPDPGVPGRPDRLDPGRDSTPTGARGRCCSAGKRRSRSPDPTIPRNSRASLSGQGRRKRWSPSTTGWRRSPRRSSISTTACSTGRSRCLRPPMRWGRCALSNRCWPGGG